MHRNAGVSVSGDGAITLQKIDIVAANMCPGRDIASRTRLDFLAAGCCSFIRMQQETESLSIAFAGIARNCREPPALQGLRRRATVPAWLGTKLQIPIEIVGLKRF